MAILPNESKGKTLSPNSIGSVVDQSEKLQKAKEKCIAFKEFMEKQMEMRQKLKSENQLLHQKLKELQEQYELVKKEKQEWNQKYEEVKGEYSDVSEQLAQVSYLLGYQITQLDCIESNTLVSTFQYDEECFVQFVRKDEHYDLMRIKPEHPNFNAIKMMLRETNDMSGLLANLRTYFKANSCKSKQVQT